MQGNKFISSTCLNKLDTCTMLTDDHVFDALGPFGRVPRTKDLRGIAKLSLQLPLAEELYLQLFVRPA